MGQAKQNTAQERRHTGSLNESPELNPVGMTQTNVAEMNERMQKIARIDCRFAEVVYFDESSSYRHCVKFVAAIFYQFIVPMGQIHQEDRCTIIGLC